MDYKKTTIKVLEFVNKAKDRKRGTAITPWFRKYPWMRRQKMTLSLGMIPDSKTQ